MNSLHFRYLVITVISTALTSAITAILLLNILISPVLITGAAFVAGFFINLMIAGMVAISAGRRAAVGFVEANKGQLVGAVMGFWVGLGALIGMVLFGLFLSRFYKADVRAGLLVIFGLVSCGICIFAARISGRENAHPPEEEEI